MFQRLNLKIAIIIIILASVTIFFTVFIVDKLINDFDEQMRHINKNTVFLDSDGKVFYVLGGYDNREYLSNLDDISIEIRQATMALEDARFYSHFGIDVIRIGGAVLSALKFKGYLEGASTITQQLVKNSVLHPGVTLLRKIKEIAYAISIETRYSKDELLLMYLNTAYFGNGYYGIEKASKGYFNLPAKEINYSEACMMAALIKKPEGYNPFKGKEGLEELNKRQRFCLNRLLELGFISVELYRDLNNSLIILNKKELEQSNFHEFYATWVMNHIEKKFGADFLKTVGLRIYTPMNRSVQKSIETVIKKYLNETLKDVAVIMLNHKTGNVLAMVGGKNFNTSQFNKATQARRQLGSSFKPFIYATAFELGYLPTDTFEDEPVEYYSADEDGFPQYYMPENYNLEYMGTLTLEEALKISNNIVSVKLLDDIKIKELVNITDKMGMPVNMKKGLCIALGCSELSLEELVSGYQIFSNGGKYNAPNYILKIEDISGKILYEYKPEEPVRVVTDSTAKTIRDILKDTVKNGTAKFADPKVVVAGGKTGTSDDYRDAWFVGFTKDFTAGVWIGRENNTPTDGEVGGGLPAIIWREFTQMLYTKQPDKN